MKIIKTDTGKYAIITSIAEFFTARQLPQGQDGKLYFFTSIEQVIDKSEKGAIYKLFGTLNYKEVKKDYIAL